jgi:hypothetical protein
MSSPHALTCRMLTLGLFSRAGPVSSAPAVVKRVSPWPPCQSRTSMHASSGRIPVGSVTSRTRSPSTRDGFTTLGDRRPHHELVADLLDQHLLGAQRLLLGAAVERPRHGDVFVLAARALHVTGRHLDQTYRSTTAHVRTEKRQPQRVEVDPDAAGHRLQPGPGRPFSTANRTSLRSIQLVPLPLPLARPGIGRLIRRGGSAGSLLTSPSQAGIPGKVGSAGRWRHAQPEGAGGHGQQNAHHAFPLVGDAQSPAKDLVARGGVEPPTFRFSEGESSCRLESTIGSLRSSVAASREDGCRLWSALQAGCPRDREQFVSKIRGSEASRRAGFARAGRVARGKHASPFAGGRTVCLPPARDGEPGLPRVPGSGAEPRQPPGCRAGGPARRRRYLCGSGSSSAGASPLGSGRRL